MRLQRPGGFFSTGVAASRRLRVSSSATTPACSDAVRSRGQTWEGQGQATPGAPLCFAFRLGIHLISGGSGTTSPSIAPRTPRVYLLRAGCAGIDAWPILPRWPVASCHRPGAWHPARATCPGPAPGGSDLPDDVPIPAARARLAETLALLGVELSGDAGRPTLRGEIDSGLAAEAYRLRIGQEGIALVAGAATGLAYGLRTLGQWLKQHGPRLGPLMGLELEDHPSFAHRGLLLDVSRNRVPHLAELCRLIELMAELKLNQLQLYFEHSFAYAGHGQVWQAASPLTAAEIRFLDKSCAERGIELVPCQNSFGHFHRWLVHEPYRALAECPEGIEHPFSLVPEPFSLCATDPQSLELLRELYGQLLPNFSSRLCNTGLDETFDLGLGRSRLACAARGKAQVYLDFLGQVRQLCAEHGRRMMFWGDVLLENPEAIPRIPADAVVLEWGYEADHPFEADAARFAASGREFYVCPGTSSWNSFGGRTANLARQPGSSGARGFPSRRPWVPADGLGRPWPPATTTDQLARLCAGRRAGLACGEGGRGIALGGMARSPCLGPEGPWPRPISA